MMAIHHCAPKAGLLHHSDRSSQYAATAYQQLLTTHGITGSVSRCGICCDNACVESFFGTLESDSSIIASTVHGKRRHRIFLNTLKYSTIGCAVTPLSATILRSNSRRGRLGRNRVSTELREGQWLYGQPLPTFSLRQWTNHPTKFRPVE